MPSQGPFDVLPARLSTLRQRFGRDPALEVAREPPGNPWIVGLADRPGHPHGDGALCLLDDPRHLSKLRGGDYAAVLCTPATAGLAKAIAPVQWEHPQARWVFATILASTVTPPAIGARNRAHIDPTAEIAATAVVGAFAVIEANARIGEHVSVGAGVVISRDCTVGEHTELGPHVVLGPGTVVGARCRVDAGAVVGAHGFGYLPATDTERGPVALAHPGGVVLEDDVHVGALATIARGTVSPTRIRRGARLDAQVHVGHNGDVGEQAFLAGQTGLAGSVTVGHDAQLGGQVGVADHVTIGPGARIAAASGVTGDVPPGVVYGGYPARPRAQWLRALARMYRRDKA